jgi:hypothetical protein
MWFTQHVAQSFENRFEIVLRGRGHTEWTDCLGKVYEQFVRSGTVRGLDASSCRAVAAAAIQDEVVRAASCVSERAELRGENSFHMFVPPGVGNLQPSRFMRFRRAISRSLGASSIVLPISISPSRW